jgi:outer membrane protein OmpA-like peptidoglycan-associated protein
MLSWMMSAEFMRTIAIIGLLVALTALAGCSTATTPTKAVSNATPTIVSDPDWAGGGFRVYFDFDSAEINPAGQAEIDSALREVSKIWDVRAINWAVTGHTDRAGSESYNMQLSLRRANAVRAALIARGVSPDLITVAGRGESEADEVREQANRLVVLIPQ